MTAQLVRRVGVYGRCTRGDSVLLTRLSPRNEHHGWWTLPGGGMDFGEAPVDTLRREFREETGLAPEIGALLGVRSQVLAPRDDRRALHVLQIVHEVEAEGVPFVRESGGSTDATEWIPLASAHEMLLVPLVRWALAL